MHRLITALIVACCGAASAQGLSGDRPQVSPGPGGAKQCAKVIVLTKEHVPASLLCSQAGCVLLAGSATNGMYLFESAEPISPLQFEAFAEKVSKLPGVVSSELLQPTGLPEIESCGMPVDVAGQQCTVAFADATPSQGEFKGQQALGLIGFGWAQNLSEHKPVLVAVIDTGIDATHPALAGQVADDGWDFLAGAPGALDVSDGQDGDGDGLVDEAHGHGTHIASVILLVNPDVRILPLRVLDADGTGNSYDVAEAILYAVDHGAQVINLSLSMKQPSNAVAMALEYAALMGVSVFASAGNTAKKQVLFPASYDPRTFELDVPLLPPGWTPGADCVTAVAASNAFGKKADFSGWGVMVDLVAPGVDVYGAMPGGGYAWWSGTSMATAVASGVASLVLSIGGSDMPVSPQNVIKQTAKSIDQWNPAYVGGLGKGFVDAWDAAKEAKKFD